MTSRVSDDLDNDLDNDLDDEAVDETADKTADDTSDDTVDDTVAGRLGEQQAEQEAEDARSERRRLGWLREGRRPVVALLVASALLAGLGGWFLTRAAELRDSPSASNTALVDAARTAEVSSAVTLALNRIFSYAYDRTEDTEAAADEVLRGSARQAYDRLFEEVRAQAPTQKLVLTSRVVSTAVQELSADRARLLVFLDQSATRADANTSNASAAQLSVTVRLENGMWVITGLEPR
jgi:Mce-associated membrane protein